MELPNLYKVKGFLWICPYKTIILQQVVISHFVQCQVCSLQWSVVKVGCVRIWSGFVWDHLWQTGHFTCWDDNFASTPWEQDTCPSGWLLFPDLFLHLFVDSNCLICSETRTFKVHSLTLVIQYFLLPNYWYKNLPTIMLRLCFCLALQFSQVLEDPSGPAYLHKYVDPALNGDYPVDSMWKVRSCGTSNSNLSHGLMSVSRVRFT